MLIALLAVLGVDIYILVTFLVVVLGRRRWLKKQPGHFFGAVRVTSGELGGMPTKWKRGSARWVRGVLAWSKTPFMFRTELVPVDRMSGVRDATDGEVKRLGDHPVVATFVAGDATFEVAASEEDHEVLTGVFAAGVVAPHV
jgi:hypothetical protein